MTTYIDSSALVPVYVPERFSKAARAAVQAASQVPFTALHQLEVPNAFELLVARGAITRDECRAILDQFHEDVEVQRLVVVSLDLDHMFARAGELSTLYTAKFLARSLDLLHVAAAHASSCTKFVSGDDRQLAVAKASGLKALDIKRPGSTPDVVGARGRGAPAHVRSGPCGLSKRQTIPARTRSRERAGCRRRSTALRARWVLRCPVERRIPPGWCLAT